MHPPMLPPQVGVACIPPCRLTRLGSVETVTVLAPAAAPPGVTTAASSSIPGSRELPSPKAASWVCRFRNAVVP